MQICHNLRSMQPCAVLGLSHTLNVLEDDVIELLVTGAAHRYRSLDLTSPIVNLSWLRGGEFSHVNMDPPGTPRDHGGHEYSGVIGSTASSASKSYRHRYDRSPDGDLTTIMNMSPSHGARSRSGSLVSQTSSRSKDEAEGAFDTLQSGSKTLSTQDGPDTGNSNTSGGNIFSHLHAPSFFDPNSVLLSSLPYVAGMYVKRYLGPIHLHFVKDSEQTKLPLGERIAVDESLYNFFSEVNAITRAQVQALGGNALLCHKVLPQEGGKGSNSSRGGGAYNMLSISGDAVILENHNQYQNFYSLAGR